MKVFSRWHFDVVLTSSLKVVVPEKKPGFGKKGEPAREAPVRVQVLPSHYRTNRAKKLANIFHLSGTKLLDGVIFTPYLS